MSVLKVLYAKFSKIDFHILSTRAQGRIYHKWSAVTFPITEWNFLCCHVWEMFAFLFAALKYSSSDLPVSYIIYSTIWRVPKVHTNGSSDTSSLRRSFWLCTASWASAGGTCYSLPSASFKFRTMNSRTCTYPELLVGGSCQCEKTFGYALQMVQLPLVLYVYQVGPFSTMLS